jgi:hypothetical protein
MSFEITTEQPEYSHHANTWVSRLIDHEGLSVPNTLLIGHGDSEAAARKHLRDRIKERIAGMEKALEDNED